MHNVMNTKTIFPDISIYQKHDAAPHEIKTYLRIKSRSGKWYLQLFWRTQEKPFTPKDVVRFVAEIYRGLLFTEVPEKSNVIDFLGEAAFTLDENQYSEHGRYYATDHQLFPKRNAPYVSEKYPNEYDQELFELWNKHFKPKY
jgi:hypothetical protein